MGTRLAYANSFFPTVTVYAGHTPKLKGSPTVLGSILTISYVFLQLKELKEAQHKTLLNTLKHPDADVQQLLKETEENTKVSRVPFLNCLVHTPPAYSHSFGCIIHDFHTLPTRLWIAGLRRT